MTTNQLTSTRSLTTLRVGVAIAAVIALIDLGGMFTIGLANAPVEVIAITSVLGVLTLGAAPFAWHGATWAVWIAAVSRALAALAVIPILFVPEAPRDALPISWGILGLTVVAIVVMFIGLRGRTART